MKKKEVNNVFATVVVALVVGAIAGIASSMVIVDMQAEKTQEELIKDFYDVETAVHVSPHGLRNHMAEELESVWVVDLRSQEEYEEEHVIGAVNVPAYKDRDNSDYGAVDRIVRQFKELQEADPNKEFIVYCYSIPCMTGRKVGKMLADHGIYVKHLGIGWNEWRYHWELWNHPHEWELTNVEDYIFSGPEPGTPPGEIEGSGCPIEGGLGC